ncbi:heme exporter protein CcmB [Burkholderiales bacterium]|nr:heme exporter protein CcmB [Burkholderiales bacterium]
MYQAFIFVLRKELLLAFRQKTDMVTVLFFFIIVSSLFPFAVGPELSILKIIGPGVVWVGALLCSLLALHRVFETDFNDGSLEHLVLSGEPLTVLVIAKVSAHWLITGLPVVIVAPLIGLQFGLSVDSLTILLITLLVGTPVLSLIGSIGAALTLGVRGGAALTSMLILPFYVPILIFGAGAVVADAQGLSIDGHFSILVAMLCLSVALAPLAIASAIKIALE